MTVLLIDGRSGAGKTRLAAALSRPTLHMDDLYAGWSGLAVGSDYLIEVLDSRRYRPWDWAHGERAGWQELPEDIIVEGVGSISRASRERADAAIWLELPTPLRKERALARDGAVFAPHWDEWAAQEEELMLREDPRRLADLVLDVAAEPFETIVERARSLSG